MEQLYNIYAGLGGGFGGANLECSEYFSSQEEADDYAYACAVEEYESYEGLHGILGWAEVAEENDLDPEIDEDEIDVIYREEIESWIDYRAVPADKDLDKED